MMDFEAFYRKIEGNIASHGQAVQGVFGDPSYPQFMYTIGNGRHVLPELLVIGNYPYQTVVQLLNDAGAKMREVGKIDEGELHVGWNTPFRVRKCGPRVKEEYTIQATNFLDRDDYEVYQILIPDREGRYPGDEGVDPNFDVDCP